MSNSQASLDGRLVVVSNRVSVPSGGRASAGGLAVGLLSALGESGGLWFGWSGKTVEAAEDRDVELINSDNITFALTDMTEAEHAGFYLGFANRTLWPLFHYRLDLTSFEHEWWSIYRAVNRRFAEELAGHLKPGDVLWIQDYHLIPMASELRRIGVDARLGFFLHIPFPAAQLLATLPWHRTLVGDLCAYDVVGFQTRADQQQLRDYVVRELHGETSNEDTLHVLGRTFKAIADPIGIDVDDMAGLGASPEALRYTSRLKTTLRDRGLILGVDRLDYTKGIPERLHAFELLLRDREEHRNKINFLQISAPSREDVPEYVTLREEVEGLVGRINGRYGEADWVPLRYINRAYSRRALAGFYRLARVGFVTALRDGLNLVAEEFVAAQDEDDPGVLVLSRFAGAAELLKGALIVNPHDTYDTAEALHRALSMRREERQERHQSLMRAIREHDIHAWRRRFLGELAAVEQPSAAA